MTDRWPPKFLLIPAVLLFLATSILPLGWMQGKFLYGLALNPEIAEKALLTSRQMILLGRSVVVKRALDSRKFAELAAIAL